VSDAGAAGRNGSASEEEARATVELARAEARAQAAAARRARGPAVTAPEETRYIGMATRALAFVIDVAIVNAIAVVTGAAVQLVMSTLKFNSSLKDTVTAILGAFYLVWVFGYFAVFWSSTGQTPGNRLLQIRVVDAGSGGSIPVRRAALRLVALTAGVMALGLGEWIALFDERSRTFQDRVARTYVVDAPVYTANDRRRMAQIAAVEEAAREESAAQG